MKNYEECTIKLEQSSRFLCDENAEMLARSPEGDFEGEKREVGAKQNKTIKSFIISHSPVTLLHWWSWGLDTVERQQPSIMSDYAV